jgi:hypothetical protein
MSGKYLAGIGDFDDGIIERVLRSPHPRSVMIMPAM